MRRFKQADLLDTAKISVLQRRRLLKLLNIEPDTDLVASQAGLICFYELLITTFPLADPEQQWLVFEDMQQDLNSYFHELEVAVSANKVKLPVLLIGIADRRYVTITSRSTILDIQNGQKLSGLNKQFLETVQYNLATLYTMKLGVKSHEV